MSPYLPLLYARRRAIAISLLCLLSAGGNDGLHAATGSSAVAGDPWQDIAIGLFNEAQAGFEELRARAIEAGAEDAARLASYGEAVALLNRQPRTQGNLSAVETMLNDIILEGSGDDLTLSSRYLLGRILQNHRLPPDPAGAETIFQELVEQHPTHPVAQRAWVKLAVLRLYARDLGAPERRERFDALGAAAETMSEPTAKSRMHLVLGEAARLLGYGDEPEIAHLLAAEKAGVAKLRLRGRVLVRIGELARRLGRDELARAHYRRFLDEFPRSDQRGTVETLLAGLSASSPVAAQ